MAKQDSKLKDFGRSATIAGLPPLAVLGGTSAWNKVLGELAERGAEKTVVGRLKPSLLTAGISFPVAVGAHLYLKRLEEHARRGKNV